MTSLLAIAYLPIVGVVSRDSSLEGMMDGVRLHIRARHISSSMRVSAVFTEIEGLSAVADLCVLHSVYSLHEHGCMDAEQLLRTIFITLNNDISGK